jgi:hypothetical protein
MGLTDIDTAAQGASAEAGMSGETGNIAQTCPKTTLEIGVFFDGTLNNRFNVLSGGREDGSYQNALSNPALLYDRYKNDPDFDEPNACGGTARAFRSVYVQGPGSTAGEADDTMGYAFGQGRQSGVEARVLEGFREVLRRVNLLGGAPYLKEVVLDVFGFSRGAAGARHFVNSIRAGRATYDPWGIGDYEETWPEDLPVSIRFVGIFDTVAAIGKATDDDNDPVNVHLRSDQASNRIYHLTAGDEYRKNFRLNRNIPGGGDTFELPGAHSDVGGGYADPGDTAPLESARGQFYYQRAEAEAARAAVEQADLQPGAHRDLEAVFVREGWLGPNETEGGVLRVMTPIVERTVTVQHGFETITRQTFTYDEQLALHRPWVQLGLSRVALHMMHEAAVAEVDGAFLELPSTDENYVIPEGLKPYEAAMRSGSLSSADRAAILRNFGHVSMKDGDFLSADHQGHGPETNHVRVEYDNDPGQAV